MSEEQKIQYLTGREKIYREFNLDVDVIASELYMEKDDVCKIIENLYELDALNSEKDHLCTTSGKVIGERGISEIICKGVDDANAYTFDNLVEYGLIYKWNNNGFIVHYVTRKYKEFAKEMGW